MRRQARTCLQSLCLGLFLLGGAIAATPAQACPMCKAAIQDKEDPVKAAQPKAYMYSILFMLSMPMTLATIFGASFYRLARQQQALNAAILNEYSDNANRPEA